MKSKRYFFIIIIFSMLIFAPAKVIALTSGAAKFDTLYISIPEHDAVYGSPAIYYYTLDGAKAYCLEMAVKVIKTNYDNDKYNLDLEPYKDEKEGGNRCHLCYEKRMKEAYDFAEEQKFDYFTTVMTISRQKNSQILNEIGKKLEKEHQFTKYFYSDFKKNKGIDIAREMRIHYDLYQQLYCGCKYTYQQGLEKEKERNNK